jgi:streptogramin lyase
VARHVTPSASSATQSPSSSPAPTSGVIRIDPATSKLKVVAHLEVGKDSAIAAGLGGVWVTSGRELIKLDPKSGKEVRTVDLDESGGAVVVGHELIWLIDGSINSGTLHPTVVGVDPSSGSISVQSPDESDGLVGLAVGERGVWATNASTGTLIEFDSLTGKELQTVQIDSSQNFRNVAAAFGAIWVVDQSTGSLSAVSESTHKTSTYDTKAGPAAVAAATDGLWVTDDSAGALVKFPLSSKKLVVVALQQGAGPLAVGGGAVWVASNVGDTLWRVDERTFRVKTLLLDGVPLDVAFGEGAVWVLYE